MQIQESNEIKNFVNDVQLAVKFRFAGYGGFSFLVLILKLLGIYSVPWSMFFILFFLSILTFSWKSLLKKSKRNIDELSLFYFLLQAIEIIFILIAVHISQITAFMGAFVLIVYFLHAQFPYTKNRYSLATLIFCIMSYATVIILEYFGILQTQDIHHVGVNVKNNQGLLIISLFLGSALMFFVSLIVGSFSAKLKNSFKVLSQKEQELQEAKDVLEIKVRARTRELEMERSGLEGRVKERTIELERRIRELENFHKITIGRELKMVELKKEIDDYKQELERLNEQVKKSKAKSNP